MISRSRSLLIAFMALGLIHTLVAGAAAQSGPKSKSTQTEAEWIAYDAEAEEVRVMVKKPGQGPDAGKMKKNKEVAFKVKAEGSVLTRTTVTINGQKADLAEIPAGKSVYVYWRPDEKERKVYHARKIDVIFSERELEEKWKAVD